MKEDKCPMCEFSMSVGSWTADPYTSSGIVATETMRIRVGTCGDDQSPCHPRVALTRGLKTPTSSRWCPLTLPTSCKRRASQPPAGEDPNHSANHDLMLESNNLPFAHRGVNCKSSYDKTKSKTNSHFVENIPLHFRQFWR